MSIFPWRRYLRNLSARRSSSFHMPGGRGKQMLYAEASSRKFQRSKSNDRIQEPVSKIPSVADASDSDGEDESRLSVESISNAIHAMPWVIVEVFLDAYGLSNIRRQDFLRIGCSATEEMVSEKPLSL